MHELTNFLEHDDNLVQKVKPKLRFSKLENSSKRVNEMHDYSSDPEFYQFLEMKPFNSIQSTKAYLNNLIERDSKGSHGGESIYWAIIDKLDDKMIGTLGFQGYNKNRSSACSTMGISTLYRHEGRAVEALLSLLEFGFKKMQLHRIWAITHESNFAVTKLHQIFGFKIEGKFRDYYNINGKYENAIQLSCLKNDYTNLTALKSLILLRKIKSDTK